jgi:hypothetical protein
MGSCCLATSCFCIEIYASGVILGLAFRILCPHGWGFMKYCTSVGGVLALVCFFVSRWVRGSGSISIPSTSYFQDFEFYPLLHIRKESLATKAVSDTELQP